MSKLIDGDSKMYGEISMPGIVKTVGLSTQNRYLDKDIELTIVGQSGSATTPATSITANPTITVSDEGVVTASVMVLRSVKPTVSPGYVSSGTSGTITVSGSSTTTLPIATVSEIETYLGITSAS